MLGNVIDANKTYLFCGNPIKKNSPKGKYTVPRIFAFRRMNNKQKQNLQFAFHLFLLKHFNRITDSHIVKVFDTQTAVEAKFHLCHIIFKPF